MMVARIMVGGVDMKKSRLKYSLDVELYNIKIIAFTWFKIIFNNKNTLLCIIIKPISQGCY